MAVIIATRNALLNLPASELPDTKGHVLVAGTTSCSPKSHKKKYGAKDKNSLKPYVDSSIIIGQSDQLLKLFSELKSGKFPTSISSQFNHNQIVIKYIM